MSDTRKAEWTPGPWTLEDSDHIHGPDGFHVTSVIAPKNGPLIASAPDLYEALEAIMHAGEVHRNDLVRAAHAALAKARGES